MRRIFLTALASTAVAIALPVAASAHGSSHSSARHASIRHHRRHHHTRFVHFASRSSVTSTTTTATSTPPASTPGESVGTIASFEGGVLKITLSDGTTVSGTVTESTEIKCPAPTPTATTSDHGGPGSIGHEDGQGQDEGSGDDEGEGHDGGYCHETPQECGPASLVVGAKVQEAELKLSGAQASWESVELAG